ncbi:hypothetical protein ABZ214_34830 [Streptomyces iakyrus]|uniref:hypothetical protein n=1 Tax=Streptomyces iakyrus TaxID=68219 RepID=UPI0033A228C1
MIEPARSQEIGGALIDRFVKDAAACAMHTRQPRFDAEATADSDARPGAAMKREPFRTCCTPRDEVTCP